MAILHLHNVGQREPRGQKLRAQNTGNLKYDPVKNIQLRNIAILHLHNVGQQEPRGKNLRAQNRGNLK